MKDYYVSRIEAPRLSNQSNLTHDIEDQDMKKSWKKALTKVQSRQENFPKKRNYRMGKLLSTEIKPQRCRRRHKLVTGNFKSQKQAQMEKILK